MNVEGGIQLAELWSIARRRAKVMAVTSVGVALAIYWAAMALPNQYESYATVLVTPQTVDPALVAAGVPDSDLNNRLYLMTAEILSRGRLSKIISELGLYADQSQHMVREQIIDMMRESVEVTPVTPELGQGVGRRNSDEEINQFRISFAHRNAETAMQVAQHLSNDFIEQHIGSRITLSQKSLEFIEDELARLAERIREVEGRVAEVKNANPGRLPEDMTATQRRLERLMTDMAFAQRSLAEAVSDEGFYRSQINNAPITAGEMTPESRLRILDLQIAEYSAKGFTDKHPDVVKTKLEIEALKQSIARVGAESAKGDDRILSYSQQNAEAERRRAELRKTSAEAEIARLRVAIDEFQTQLPGFQQPAARGDGSGPTRAAPTRRAVSRTRGRIRRARGGFTQSPPDHDSRFLDCGWGRSGCRSHAGERGLVAAQCPPTPDSLLDSGSRGDPEDPARVRSRRASPQPDQDFPGRCVRDLLCARGWSGELSLGQRCAGFSQPHADH